MFEKEKKRNKKAFAGCKSKTAYCFHNQPANIAETLQISQKTAMNFLVSSL